MTAEPAPEFARPERVDTIGAGVRTIEIVADDAERAALARRFGLLSIESLSARLSLRCEAGAILVTGAVLARVTQACSVTGDPLAQTIDEPLDLRFVPTAAGGAANAGAAAGAEGTEIELDPDALDVIEFAGGTIDLGEAAAETVALAIDPFPRGPGAEAALRAAGVLREEEAGPLAAGLAALRARLSPPDPG